MQPRPWPPVPPETGKIARSAFRKGTLAMRVRDQLGSWCDDEAFAAVYGVRGAPGISPAQLAMVTVLQFTENLTDRQAADAVRGRLDWKYCLGLPLADEGFDHSVLSEFRTRLVAGGLEQLMLDRLLVRLAELGLVAAGRVQRTDSTHVLAAVRGLNRLELAGETVRAAAEALAAAAPGWLAGVVDDSWQRVYGPRVDDWRLPKSPAERDRLAQRYGRDGFRLLEAVYSPDAPGWLAELPAVETLRRVWVQQYYRSIDEHGAEEVVRRERQVHGLPPGHTVLISPYDLDARNSEKHGMHWGGYKVHFSETCSRPAGHDPDGGQAPGSSDQPARADVPNLVTNVATTAASVPDVVMTEPIHDALASRGLSPGEHAVDTGYLSADVLLAARARGINLVGPLLADTSTQARTGGYTIDMFDIDWDRQQVTCPQGATSSSWTPVRIRNTDAIVARFSRTTCRDCPARKLCTRARYNGRELTLRPRPVHEATRAARAEQTSQQWQHRYKIRAGVEGTIGQATHITGIRHARYRGLPKTRLEHTIAATAINLIRLDAWWTSTPLERTRTTHLQRVDLTLAA